MDLNLETMAVMAQCLKLKWTFSQTAEYFRETTDHVDLRWLANGKKDPSEFEPYTQVFGNKHGFLNNLSILDLLFNEGRFALDYLMRQPQIISEPKAL